MSWQTARCNWETEAQDQTRIWEIEGSMDFRKKIERKTAMSRWREKIRRDEETEEM